MKYKIGVAGLVKNTCLHKYHGNAQKLQKIIKWDVMEHTLYEIT